MEAGPLQLFDTDVNIYDIMDNLYPDDDWSQDQLRRSATKNKRCKGKKLLKKRFDTSEIEQNDKLCNRWYVCRSGQA